MATPPLNIPTTIIDCVCDIFVVPVHYLLYNPANIPPAQLPASSTLATVHDMKIGCRVIKADHLDSKLSAVKLRRSSSPTFQQVAGTPFDPNFWTLHNFVADLVLGWPASVAISVTIDAPVER